jgi:hypothetical protein
VRWPRYMPPEQRCTADDTIRVDPHPPCPSGTLYPIDGHLRHRALIINVLPTSGSRPAAAARIDACTSFSRAFRAEFGLASSQWRDLRAGEENPGGPCGRAGLPDEGHMNG